MFDSGEVEIFKRMRNTNENEKSKPFLSSSVEQKRKQNTLKIMDVLGHTFRCVFSRFCSNELQRKRLEFSFFVRISHSFENLNLSILAGKNPPERIPHYSSVNCSGARKSFLLARVKFLPVRAERKSRELFGG